jgi:type I restriction enzyme M protein
MSDDTTLLVCPVRRRLTAKALAKDGLTPTEEKRRIELIQYLLARGYPSDHIAVETTVIRDLGEEGRNSLRADVVVYDIERKRAKKLGHDARLHHILIVAEVKRDAKKKERAIATQLEPAVRQLPNIAALGVYWDDTNRIVLHRERVHANDGGETIEVARDNIASLPPFGQPFRYQPITLDVLTPPSNLVAILETIANALRSEGINDEHVRYKESVKLLLARYIDERLAVDRPDHVLDLQVFKEGADPTFLSRVERVYDAAATRYSSAATLFKPVRGSELNEHALRRIVGSIEGVHLSEATSDSLQQVFMSFVPAVFKKSLDQYFTPLTLIEAMVTMAEVGPTDKVADPAMGTADFLVAAMADRIAKGDSDMAQRVFGADKDQQAYDLAVINMVLNRDGQAGLHRVDSIENITLWENEMGVVLCNPPFGSRTVELRDDVLSQYDLGHIWEVDYHTGEWTKTDEILPSQQLGILFIERGYRMLADGGRMAIIVPEGYLCTQSYGYIRRWLLDHVEVMSLIELPRRMFLKSDADLRSNILLVRRLSPRHLKARQDADYPIHAELVRKVGMKLGKGFPRIYLRDEETGLRRTDSDNEPLLDTDFTRVLAGFRRYRSVGEGSDGWDWARFSDVEQHANLDMKPRRLVPSALRNLREVRAAKFKLLADFAEVCEETIDIASEAERAKMRRLVEGQSIRAVEGIVIPGQPERSWHIAERKSALVYPLQSFDIVLGLVRPERRNIGLLIDDGTGLRNVVGSPDGVAIIRVAPEMTDEYPIAWLFEALRSERCRLQLWTESGGTSYGKLTLDHIRDLSVPMPTARQRRASAQRVAVWAETIGNTLRAWNRIGSPGDRVAIINSAIIGLEGEDEA